MKLSEFDFHVPEHLIAQRPLDDREGARMLVLNRDKKTLEHRKFRDLPEHLRANDLMVFNRSKVIKARLLGTKSSGGKIEIFLLHKKDDETYECLLKTGSNKKEGIKFSVSDILHGEVLATAGNEMVFQVRFASRAGMSVSEAIEVVGKIPLPPYIRREPESEDGKRYQTIYGDALGSVAAPTAGLHFTDRILREIKSKGIGVDFVTLHVGLGTFQPIKVDDIDHHTMHEEFFTVDPELLTRIQATKTNNGRVIAVGTTSVRALESAARKKEGSTNLFLKPGEKFHTVDALFTNFHQPKSTLVVMLSAFVGDKDFLFHAYEEAVRAEYRFFSYGDCMLVI